MLSEADLSPLTTIVALSTTAASASAAGARPKGKKKQGAAAEAGGGGGGGGVNGVAGGVDKENEVAAFLRVQVSLRKKIPTEFPLPSFIEIFRLSFREFPRLVGRYCS